jgi:hypothetical protein
VNGVKNSNMIKSKYDHLIKKWKNESKKQGLSFDIIRGVIKKIRKSETEEFVKQFLKENTSLDIRIGRFLKKYWVYIILSLPVIFVLVLHLWVRLSLWFV